MAPRTLDPERMSLDELFDEIAFTVVRLRLSSLASPHLAAFEILDTEAKAVQVEERRLAALLLAAEAAIDWIDEEIDGSVRLLSASILKIVRNDRNDPLYLRYFGGQTPSELARPVLGRELTTVRGWVDSLKASPHDELKDLGTVIEQQVTAADNAVQARQETQQQMEDFRRLGARARIFERVNAERKTTQAGLATLPRGDADRRLSRDFAERFFRQNRRRPSGELSVDEAREALERMRKAMAEAEANLRAAEERAQQAVQAKAERAAAEAELVATKRAITLANRRAAELRDKLDR
jgi:hypothetical protein